MLITEDLIALIERSEAARLQNAAELYGGDNLEIGGGVAAFCGDGNPMTNCVSVGVGCSVSDSEFARVLEFYEGRTKVFEFKLSPLSGLELREWVVREAKSLPEFETMLVMDIFGFEGGARDGLDIREISGDETPEYAERAMFRFFSGGDLPPGGVDVVAACCVSDVSRSFEVWVDGAPVAGCGLGLVEGISWLQGASVLPEYRGRGLHKAMQAYRMRIAKEAGYGLMAQGALPGSASQLNAQKIGFEIAYTRPSFLL